MAKKLRVWMHLPAAWSTAAYRLSGLALIALLAPGFPGTSWSRGQAPSPHAATQDAPQVPSPTFDVVSVRESKPGNSYTMNFSDNPHASLVRFTNMRVTDLLAATFPIQRFQIIGLPDWTQRATFNVEAKSGSEVDEHLAKLTATEGQTEKRHMMASMLADRFKLKSHWEMREGPLYELTVAKSGSKLHEGGSVPESAQEKQMFGGDRIPTFYQRGDGRRGYEFLGHGCSLDDLAEGLSGQLDEPILNKTGLTKGYDFALQYHGALPTDATEDPSWWPPLITAVPEQLGLALKAGKGERRVLVVDHIEKPSEN